jgi:large subunit ribosomal protein L24e
MKWTKAFRKSAGKEMVLDSTFMFEKRRNCPVRYDRDLVVKTVQAMKKIDKIKEDRKARFYKERMLKAHIKQLEPSKREIAKHSSLMNGPHIPQVMHSTQQSQENDQKLSLKTDQTLLKKVKQKIKIKNEDVEMEPIKPIIH